MDNTSDSAPAQKAISIPHQEIRDFEISMDFSQFWIDCGDRRYPVILTPYDFAKLFEIEGVPIESFTGDEPVRFTKAILMRAGYNVCGETFNEDGSDITAQQCWVKDPDFEYSTETQFIPTPY